MRPSGACGSCSRPVSASKRRNLLDPATSDTPSYWWRAYADSQPTRDEPLILENEHFPMSATARSSVREAS